MRPLFVFHCLPKFREKQPTYTSTAMVPANRLGRGVGKKNENNNQSVVFLRRFQARLKGYSKRIKEGIKQIS